MPPTGLYEFRIPYCGCDTCNLVTGDFAECSSYETYGKSVTVEVVAPIDLAPFTGMEQVAVGFIWYEVVDFLQQALDKVNAVRVRGGPCARIAVCEMTRPPLRATDHRRLRRRMLERLPLRHRDGPGRHREGLQRLRRPVPLLLHERREDRSGGPVWRR